MNAKRIGPKSDEVVVGTNDPDNNRDASSKHVRRLIHEVVERHFDEKPRKLAERIGGLTNAVYTFKVSQGEYVFRTHRDAGKIGDYYKEQWAMDAARAAGVPTPRVLEVGNVAAGDPYMISERIHGVDGCEVHDRLKLLETLGQTAAVVHGVRTHDFGAVFDWSGNRLSRYEGWSEWLKLGFDVEGRLQILRHHGVLDFEQTKRLRETAAAMTRWRKPPVLHHGDLRLKNTIVDPDSGRLLALIDWESSMSSPAPYWDLAVALHDLGIDEKEAFLTGYGLSARSIAAALPFIRLFNVLNYAKPVEGAAATDDVAGLARYRLRLKGGLELYEAA